MRIFFIIFATVAVFFGMTGISSAGDSDLDPTFGTGGVSTATWNPSHSLGGSDIALQGDGKIVQVGGYKRSWDNYGGDIILARYTSDGVLDTTFSGDGQVTTDFFSSPWPQASDESASTVAIQSDGKIIVGGTTRTDPDNQNNPPFDWTWWNSALVRYNTDGSLDSTFAVNGIMELEAGLGSADGISDIALQMDGKIVTVGYYMVGSNNRFLIMRFNNDGTLDTTFGTDGYVREHFTENTLEHAYAVAIQSDGKIIVVGYGVGGDGRYKISMLRLTSTGALDNTFSADGKLVTLAGQHSKGADVVIDNAGKILVGGWSTGTSTDTNERHFLLVRYNADGTLDTTFDSNGMVITPFPYTDYRYSTVANLALRSDGRIVAAGSYVTTGSRYDIALARYNTDGTLDTTFDSDDGLVVTDFTQYDFTGGVALQSDDKIIVGGSKRIFINNVYTAQLITLRYGAEVFNMTIASSPVNGGTTIPIAGTTLVPPSPQAISATANSHYTFTNWTTSGGEAVVADPNEPSTSVTLTGHATVTANFAIDTYVVSAGVDVHGTLDASSAIIDYGSSASFTVTPAVGYTTDSAVGGDCPAGSWNGTVYTTGAVTGAYSVSFTHTINSYTVNASVDAHGTLDASFKDVIHGSSASFTVTPAAGYTTDSAVGGDCPVGSWSGTTYTTGAVAGACSVSFTHTINTYAVNSSVAAGGNGGIAPEGNQTVIEGEILHFTLTPAPGYHIDQLTGTCKRC